MCLCLAWLAGVMTPTQSLIAKVHGANMGPIWGRQDLGGPHVGPMNFAIMCGIMCGFGIYIFDHIWTLNHTSQMSHSEINNNISLAWEFAQDNFLNIIKQSRLFELAMNWTYKHQSHHILHSMRNDSVLFVANVTLCLLSWKQQTQDITGICV